MTKLGRWSYFLNEFPRPPRHMIWVPAFAGMSGFWFDRRMICHRPRCRNYRDAVNVGLTGVAEATGIGAGFGAGVVAALPPKAL